MRIGILSTSSIAPRFIAAVREAQAGQIVALSSRSLEKAREKAALWEIPTAYGDHMQLLADERVDVVYISTVNALHYPWAKEALEHGKHVICEKPMTITPGDTAALFDLAAEKGLFLMEAQKMLFLPAILEVRRRIENGELGEICMAELNQSVPANYNGWMMDASVGGGPLLTSSIYGIQLLLWLFGPLHGIRGSCTADENGMELQYILSGKMENGVLFSAKNSTLGILDNCARIYGSKGWAEIPEYWKARKAIFHLPGKPEEVVEHPCTHELVYEVQHIKDCLQRGLLTSPVVTRKLSVDGISALVSIKERWKGSKE